jgi:hypothetical protein
MQSIAEPVTLVVDKIKRDSIVHDSSVYKDLGLYIYIFGLGGK